MPDTSAYRGLVALLIAMAFEPLSVATIADLLRRTGADAGDEQQDRVRAVLAQLGAMVRERFAPDLTQHFELYHTELRDYLRTAASVAMVRGAAVRLLLENATRPGEDAATSYLLRFGVRHLLDAGRAADAATMATGLVYQLRG